MGIRNNNKFAIFLMGPTASGKTELALNLAGSYPIKVISVDSAMVYRDLNIGTSKPSQDQLAAVDHYLIDICSPDHPYSVATFCQDAIEAMNNIIATGHIPLLTGGTMLYFYALQNGLSDLPSASVEIRQLIFNKAQEIGWPAMHQQLLKLDPISANKIHPNDSQRIQRALEVIHATNKPFSEFCNNKSKKSLITDWKILTFAIRPVSRLTLHNRIAIRFEKMLKAGLIDEVAWLRQQYCLTQGLPSMRAVGYRQVWQYLEKVITLEEMQEKAIAATRQLAKRQLTWLNNWTRDIILLNLENHYEKIIMQHLNNHSYLF